jgi:hypothetical protein
MAKKKKTQQKKDKTKSIESENKNTKTTRRKIEDILDKREFNKLFEL